MADVRTPELVINKLSKQQYESIQNPSDTELYLVPEDEEHKPICYPTTCELVAPSTSKLKLTSSVNDNGSIITQCGFVWNTIGNPTLSDNLITVNPVSGIITSELQCSNVGNHYIRSFATNSNGTSYGDILIYDVGNLTLDTLSDMWELKPIPSSYQRLDYINFSKNAVIGTDLYYSSDNSINLRTKIKFRIPEANWGNYTSIMSAYNGENNMTWRLMTPNTLLFTELWVYCTSNAGGGAHVVLPLINNKFSNTEILMTYNKVVYNGIEYDNTNNHTSATATTNQRLYIGAPSFTTSEKANILLYSFYHDNTYTSQGYYKPCIIGGRPALYNVILNTYYQSGSGSEANPGNIINESEINGILLTNTTAHILESNQDYIYNGTTWVLQS